MKGKFRNPAHAKEGYAISDCIDERHARLLEFLIPILYPEKPTRVTGQVANTIFGALADRPVHWGKCLTHLVGKMVEHIAPGKPSPISPYLFHLYSANDVLSADEVVAYDVGYNILKFNFTDELEKEPEVEEEPEKIPDEAPAETEEAAKNPARRKSTDLRGRGEPEPKTPPETQAAEDFFDAGLRWMREARQHHEHIQAYVTEIAKELNVEPLGVLEAVRKLAKPEALEAKDAIIRDLEKDRDDLQARTDWAETECREAQDREKEALRLVRNLSTMLSQPAEAAVRANLYNTQLVSEGHIVGSRVVMVLVEFQARMEVVLKEMRALVERVDPNRIMEYPHFPELDTLMKTPVKSQEVAAAASEGGLGSLLAQPLTTSSPQPNREIPIPGFRNVSTKGSGSGSGIVRSDLSDRWGSLTNPARSHPEQFEHMNQPSPKEKKKTKDTINLGEEESPEEEKVEISSDEEEFPSDYETEEDSPPKRRIQTRSATKPTARAALPKIPKPPTTGSSAKRPRKAK